MSAPHHIIPGQYFTREAWDGPLKPLVDRLAETPGGLLVIAVEVAPKFQNWPDVTFTVFSKEERAAIRRAILNLRKKAKAA